MPKPISPYLQNLIGADNTRPVVLVEIHWTVPRHLTSWDKSVTWNTIIWDSIGVRTSDIDESDPQARISIQLPNADGYFTGLLLDQGVGQTVVVHRTWADSASKTSYAPDEVMRDIFYGKLAGASRVGNPVVFTAVSASVDRRVPFIRLQQPLANHNAVPGVPVQFNRKTIGVTE